jgi:mono/diheme cytochrome c family protein
MSRKVVPDRIGCKMREVPYGWRPALILGTLLLGAWGCNGDALPPDYRALEVPEARLASAEARRRGRDLFLEHCAICHGQRADGRGPRSGASIRPADFTELAWRQRMDPRRTFFVVREGLRGTPMGGWKILTADQTWDVVAYVLSVAEMGSDPHP